MSKEELTIEEAAIEYGGFHKNTDPSGFPEGVDPGSIFGLESFLYTFMREGYSSKHKHVCNVLVLEDPLQTLEWVKMHQAQSGIKIYELNEEHLGRGADLRHLKPLQGLEYFSALGAILMGITLAKFQEEHPDWDPCAFRSTGT